MNIVKVVGLIVSANGVTLFLDSGMPQVFSQESWETRKIVEQVTPALARESFAEIDLDSFSIEKKLAAETGLKVEKTDDGKILVEDNRGRKHDVTGIQKHIERAVYGQASKGFARFMSAFGDIRHKHTSEELLKFMEVGDLPIADDGSIIGYKIVKRHGAGGWCDPHTGAVRQKLGTLVYMPASKVDDDRRVACSTGLHICSKDYVGGFWGSEDRAVFLVKIKPQDVIAVPERETTKMRVAAYHLVEQLPAEVCQELRNGISAVKSEAGRAALARVITGQHTAILERVQVTGYGDTQTTQITGGKIAAKTVTSKEGAQKIVRASLKTELAPKVDPKAVRDMVKAAQTGDMSAAITSAATKITADGAEISSRARRDNYWVKPAPVTRPKQKPKPAVNDKKPLALGGDFVKANGKPDVTKASKRAKGTDLNKPNAQDQLARALKRSQKSAKLTAKEKKERDFLKKVERAKKMLAKGVSKREVCRLLKMDREALTARL